jgi:hypothetical protein
MALVTVLTMDAYTSSPMLNYLTTTTTKITWKQLKPKPLNNNKNYMEALKTTPINHPF